VLCNLKYDTLFIQVCGNASRRAECSTNVGSLCHRINVQGGVPGGVGLGRNRNNIQPVRLLRLVAPQSTLTPSHCLHRTRESQKDDCKRRPLETDKAGRKKYYQSHRQKTEADLDVQLVTFLTIEPGFPLLNSSKLISLRGGRKPRPPMGQRPYLPRPSLQLGQPIDPKVSKVV
jgi:hypothetical protein